MKQFTKNCAAYASISRTTTQGTAIQRSALWRTPGSRNCHFSFALPHWELSDSRNRQAAETKGGQNEDQIWQRVYGAIATAEPDEGQAPPPPTDDEDVILQVEFSHNSAVTEQVGIGFVSNTDKQTDVRSSGAEAKHKVDIMYYYMILVLDPDFSAREIRAAKRVARARVPRARWDAGHGGDVGRVDRQ
jgi:hypothetical protein